MLHQIYCNFQLKLYVRYFFCFVTSLRCLTNCIAHVCVMWNCLCVQVCGCSCVHFGSMISLTSLKIKLKSVQVPSDHPPNMLKKKKTCLNFQGTKCWVNYPINCSCNFWLTYVVKVMLPKHSEKCILQTSAICNESFYCVMIQYSKFK